MNGYLDAMRSLVSNGYLKIFKYNDGDKVKNKNNKSMSLTDDNL